MCTNRAGRLGGVVFIDKALFHVVELGGTTISELLVVQKLRARVAGGISGATVDPFGTLRSHFPGTSNYAPPRPAGGFGRAETTAAQ